MDDQSVSNLSIGIGKRYGIFLGIEGDSKVSKNELLGFDFRDFSQIKRRLTPVGGNFMSLDVIGTGFGRTGTNSLKLALEQLGFGLCHHMFEVFESPDYLLPIWMKAVHEGVTPDWDEIFENYRSTVDWPTAFYWKELVDLYPEAKVVHTTRSPKSWVESARNTIFVSMSERNEKKGAARDLSTMAWELIVMQIFDGKIDDFDYVADIFRKHDEAVKAYVSPDRLLIYEVSEGWEPLCRHLSVPVPEEAFPRTNTTDEYKVERKVRQAELEAKSVE
jgi:hypothetical protein